MRVPGVASPYLIMGVGVSIAARWVPVIERGGFSPIPFFYVMGGSLVFLFLTWHIPSVAGSMMAGAVSLSLADVLVPGAMAMRTSGAVVHSGALLGGLVLGAGRRGADHLRSATTIHTGSSFRDGGASTGAGTGATGGGPIVGPGGMVPPTQASTPASSTRGPAATEVSATADAIGSHRERESRRVQSSMGTSATSDPHTPPNNAAAL